MPTQAIRSRRPLKLLLIIALLITTAAFTPLRHPLKTFFIMEYIAYADGWLVNPDSPLLGPTQNVAGREAAIDSTPLANLNNDALNQWIEGSQTQALLIQHQGRIVHESYTSKTQDGSNWNALSMSKTVTALLIGIAMDNGLIESEHQPIREFLPELPPAPGEPLTIRDLLQQQSGMHDALPDVLTTLNNNSLEATLNELEFEEDRTFTYSNINYYLLRLILTRVNQQPLNVILSEQLWQPMQLQSAQVINQTGYCCVFASARSWLALAELFLNNGEYQGQTIVSKTWIHKMIFDRVQPESFVVQLVNRDVNNEYSYHMFSGLDGYPDVYWSEGMGLQLMMIFPRSETIVVRLGDIPSALKPNTNRWQDTLVEGLLEVMQEEGLVVSR